MPKTKSLAEILSGMPHYGVRVLHSEKEPLKAHTINGIQIYLEKDKYFFRNPESKDSYICIGQVGVCDELTIQENFAKIISSMGYRTEKGKLIKSLWG